MRLTWRRADGAVCSRVEKGTDYNYIAGEFTQKVYDKLAAYENAEEQGLLVRLPCKVGDTVYKLWYAPCHNGETYPDGMGCDGCFDRCDIHKEVTEFTVPNVNFIWVNFVMKGNTTYYLTREEAEAAMKGERKDV